MSKSAAKRNRNGFVRIVRAETAINCWTRALGFVVTRDRDTAVKLMQERVIAARQELQAAVAKRDERRAAALTR